MVSLLCRRQRTRQNCHCASLSGSISAYVSFGQFLCPVPRLAPLHTAALRHCRHVISMFGHCVHLYFADFQRNLKAEVALAESAGCQSMRATSYSIRAQLVTLKLPYLSRRPPLRLARRCGAPRLPPGLGVTSLLARPAGSGAAAAGLRVRACQWFNVKFESDTLP